MSWGIERAWGLGTWGIYVGDQIIGTAAVRYSDETMKTLYTFSSMPDFYATEEYVPYAEGDI